MRAPSVGTGSLTDPDPTLTATEGTGRAGTACPPDYEPVVVVDRRTRFTVR